MNKSDEKVLLNVSGEIKRPVCTDKTVHIYHGADLNCSFVSYLMHAVPVSNLATKTLAKVGKVSQCRTSSRKIFRAKEKHYVPAYAVGQRQKD